MMINVFLSLEYATSNMSPTPDQVPESGGTPPAAIIGAVVAVVVILIVVSVTVAAVLIAWSVRRKRGKGLTDAIHKSRGTQTAD